MSYLLMLLSFHGLGFHLFMLHGFRFFMSLGFWVWLDSFHVRAWIAKLGVDHFGPG